MPQIHTPLSTLSRMLRRLGLGILVLGLLGAVLYVLTGYYYTYSEGESVGFVQKLSRKGWICKTWEGEQIRALGQQINLAEKFSFTVRDEAVVHKINALIGQKVVLDYRQHIGLPSCFGDTEYFVVDAKSAP